MSIYEVEKTSNCIITLYTLILLYFPQAHKLSISPILVITFTLLLFLLRLGAIQRLQLSVTEGDETIEIKQSKDTNFGKSSDSCSLTHVDKWGASRCAEKDRFHPGPSPKLEVSFVEWDVSAPLEVIYEEEEEQENPNGKDEIKRNMPQKQQTKNNIQKRGNRTSKPKINGNKLLRENPTKTSHKANKEKNKP
ncbi:hypothetical protein SADUNF_Sadunf14G0140100 [Salix dunnii]|uniref:Uncharacterized protein n=1 Tax=Salix dunnii TaxID=1413687 RepID=A0A835JEJ4_9ROSI|nr:hypothetical protein SADUNF_Sadunf14G0140100 [Salix dunnii]